MVNSIKYGISIIWYVIILFLQKEFHMNTLENTANRYAHLYKRSEARLRERNRYEVTTSVFWETNISLIIYTN